MRRDGAPELTIDACSLLHEADRFLRNAMVQLLMLLCAVRIRTIDAQSSVGKPTPKRKQKRQG